MSRCMTLAAGAIVLAIALSGLHRLALLQGDTLHVAYGIGYAVVAFLWLIGLRNCKPEWPAALHRTFALLTSAGMALVDVFTAGFQGEAWQQLFFSALLGAALVQVGARLVGRGTR